MTEPEGFRCKKWTLVTFALISIVLSIIVVIVGIIQLDNLERPSGTSQADFDEAKSSVRTTLIGAVVLQILFQLLGLIGALKENYCLTITYAILMALITLGGIYSALETPVNWASVVIDGIITVVAILFITDLKKIRNTVHTQAAPAAPGWNI